MVTRGIRNNNPFNIKKSNNKWLGKLKVSTDPDFEQFETLNLGIRAGVVLLRRYVKRYHLTNVNDILKRFCPDNNLSCYIRYVKNKDVAIYTPDCITFPSYSFCMMCSRMLKFESGLDFEPRQVMKLINEFDL